MLKDLFSNRLFIGALAFFVLCVAGSLIYMQYENQKGAEYAAETQDRVEQWNAKQKEQPPSEAPVVDQPERVGHFHPDGTWHGEPHAPGAQLSTDAGDTPTPVASSPRTGPLTYHADLLASNPVEALRAQAEERGHWSARWIPPFPPDDHEAQTFARNSYLSIYYDEGTPEFERAVRAQLEQLREIRVKYPFNARSCDLSKITWTFARFTVDHYDPKTGYAIYPSDYFPVHISDLK